MKEVQASILKCRIAPSGLGLQFLNAVYKTGWLGYIKSSFRLDWVEWDTPQHASINLLRDWLANLASGYVEQNRSRK